MRCDLTDCTRFLLSIHIVVDKMHMQGHIDSWCRENCNPRAFKELNDVNGAHMIIIMLYVITVYIDRHRSM